MDRSGQQPVDKDSKILGQARAELCVEVNAAYEHGSSIPAIAAVRGSTILLVDDVFTSGSQLQHVAL